MLDTSRAIMQDVPEGMRKGLSTIAIKVSDINKMTDAIEHLTWEFNSEDRFAVKVVDAVNGVASGIEAIATNIEDFIGELELADSKAESALSKPREELDTAIANLKAAREHLEDAMDANGVIAKSEGVGSDAVEKHAEECIDPAHDKLTDAEVALLKVIPATPLDFIRKLDALLDDGGSDIGADQDGYLIKQAQRLLSAA